MRTVPIAHRGLHNAAAGYIENAPTAFEAAARAGYAIELDVHGSADGEAIVFHDRTLDRLTGTRGRIAGRTAKELTGLNLLGSHETIPTLGDVLDLVDGRVPLLIEIKSRQRRVGKLEARVASLLDGYTGEAAVQSFNPYSMGWFVEHAPHIARGQLALDYRKLAKLTPRRVPAMAKICLRHMLLNYISKPNFVSYEWGALPSWAAKRVRMFGLPVIAWTVDSPDIAAQVARHVDNIIFEGFQPLMMGRLALPTRLAA